MNRKQTNHLPLAIAFAVIANWIANILYMDLAHRIPVLLRFWTPFATMTYGLSFFIIMNIYDKKDRERHTYHIIIYTFLSMATIIALYQTVNLIFKS